MSFDQIERDPQRGRPVELYKFVYGDGSGSFYAYTNADREITHDGVTFKPIPISRENYRSSGKTEAANMTIKCPLKADLANLFLDYPPTQPVTVTVWQGHLGDTQQEFLVVWLGRILSTAREGDEAVLSCSSTIISLKRPGLRRNYQYSCPHVLFGDQCKASRPAASTTATVIAITPQGLTLSPGWQGEWPLERFAGGMIRWTGNIGTEYRTILRVEPSGLLRFIGPLRSLEAGSQLTIMRGCNHLMDGCNTHNNINNFGGQPWIPLKNPAKHHNFW